MCATPAHALPQLATSGSGTWTFSWASNGFTARDGWVDIWTICTPKANKVRAHDVDVVGGLGFNRSIRVACDRRGHWLRRIAVPKNTVLHVSGDTYDFGDMATGCTSVYGNGTRLR